MVPTFPALATTGIGLVTPYDFALDRELWRWTPDDVTLHLTRLPFAPLDVTVEMVTMLGEPDEIVAATRQVITVAPKVVVYACTSGSFIRGRDGERSIRQAVTSAGAPAAITTSGALVEALDTLDVRRVAIATPYIHEITAALSDFLEASGRTVVGVSDLSMEAAIWTLQYDAVADLVRAADHPDAEAIVISCTNVPTYDLIAPLEAELGKPIVTANQVTMWAALRLAGHRAVGPGQRLVEA
jgi:maleate isomerase